MEPNQENQKSKDSESKKSTPSSAAPKDPEKNETSKSADKSKKSNDSDGSGLNSSDLGLSPNQESDSLGSGMSLGGLMLSPINKVGDNTIALGKMSSPISPDADKTFNKSQDKSADLSKASSRNGPSLDDPLLSPISGSSTEKSRNSDSASSTNDQENEKRKTFVANETDGINHPVVAPKEQLVANITKKETPIKVSHPKLNARLESIDNQVNMHFADQIGEEEEPDFGKPDFAGIDWMTLKKNPKRSNMDDDMNRFILENKYLLEQWKQEKADEAKLTQNQVPSNNQNNGPPKKSYLVGKAIPGSRPIVQAGVQPGNRLTQVRKSPLPRTRRSGTQTFDREIAGMYLSGVHVQQMRSILRGLEEFEPRLRRLEAKFRLPDNIDSLNQFDVENVFPLLRNKLLKLRSNFVKIIDTHLQNFARSNKL